MASSREDVLAVEAATDLLARGLSRADISSIADLATDATLVMPAGRRTSKGPAAIEAWRRLAMASDGVQLLSTDMDTLAAGLIRDVGVLGIRLRQGGERLLFRYLMLWQKAGDVWTVAAMTWNQEPPPGAGPRQGGGQAEAGGAM